jgi:histidinol-phosphate phosphatase family protein
MTAARAVFFDRDGTLGGAGGYCHPDEFVLFDFAPRAVKLVRDAGFLAIVITNQSRIAKGQITLSQVETSFQRLQTGLLEGHGTQFDAWYICPHVKADACDCKKPAPGLLQRAALEHGIDLSRSFVVGDSGFNDLGAAAAVGCNGVLVRTGEGNDSLTIYRQSWLHTEPDFIADTVLEAAEWIVASAD